MRFLTLSLLAASIAAHAQQPNTVSTAVSTIQSAAAGTASFQVQFYDANSNSSLDSALAILGGAGAAAANLSGISVSLSQSGGFLITEYDFVVNVPAGEFAATRDKLVAAQRALANSNSQAVGWSIDYKVTDEDTAKALEQALPNLMTQAKRQAEVMAAAMGVKLGKISSLSTPAVVKTGLSLTVSATVTYLVE